MNRLVWGMTLGLATALCGGDDNRKVPATSKDMEAKAKRLIESAPNSEGAMMAEAILKGSQLGPGEGWFKAPSQWMYEWKWLAKRCNADEKSKFGKPPAIPDHLFDILDRDGDGELAASDLDWSPNAPFVRQMQMAAALFRPADRDGNGRLSADEWTAVFRRTGKDELSQEEVRMLVFPKASKPPIPSVSDGGPSPDLLLRGLFAGEIGSIHEGPKVGDKAPDFALKTTDGKQSIRLSERIGKKPIVLVFGNFTCGPFRSWGQALSELADKHKDRADFLGVYVREAHPSDGWTMEHNEKAGIVFPQPKTDAERAAAAEKCLASLKSSYPLLVDRVDDVVGHAYSGMPARLYVIDARGVVAYKSARGPFGFRPQEMEQALALTMLAATPVPTPPTIGASRYEQAAPP